MLTRARAQGTCFFFLAVLFLVAPVSVADSVYLFVDGIDGNSQNQQHNGWTDVIGLSHGLAGPNPGAPQLTDISVLKVTNLSSPLLNLFTSSNTVIQDVKIEVCRDGQQQECYYLLELSNVRVTGVDVAASSCIDPTTCGGTPTENVTFAFQQITWTYTPFTGGKKGAPVSAGYDVSTGKKR